MCASFAPSSFGLKRQTRRDMEIKELKERINTVIDIEQRSASMAPISPLYVSRMLNVPLKEVEKCMKEMGG